MASDAAANGLLETIFQAADGARLRVRPMREEDEEAIGAFLEQVDPDDIRLRFFATVRIFDHRFLWPLVHYDHRQAIAYIAFDEKSGAVVGGARLHCDVFRTFGEFAILIRSDLKREGLGHFLMTLLIDWAREHGIPVIQGEVLRENAPMLALCRRLGFRVKTSHDDPGVMNVELAVEPPVGTDTAPASPEARV